MDYVGMELHQKFSELCVVDDAGEVVERATIATTEAALRRWFKRDRMRIAVEASSVSPWVDLLLRELGHEVFVVNPRRVRLIAEATLKTDKVDAELRARLGKDSSNAGKPPSSDSSYQVRPPGKEGSRKPGGQPGHEGHAPDVVAPGGRGPRGRATRDRVRVRGRALPPAARG